MAQSALLPPQRRCEITWGVRGFHSPMPGPTRALRALRPGILQANIWGDASLRRIRDCNGHAGAVSIPRTTYFAPGPFLTAQKSPRITIRREHPFPVAPAGRDHIASIASGVDGSTKLIAARHAGGSAMRLYCMGPPNRTGAHVPRGRRLQPASETHSDPNPRRGHASYIDVHGR
jgi:hypothetical protein